MSFPQKSSRRPSAFSLVEVVLAVGVVSFSLLVLMGMIPNGLKTFHDTMGESAQVRVMQQIRAQMQQVSFGTNASGVDYINTLSQQTNYYDNYGALLTNSTGAYYMAAFQTTNAAIPSTNSAAAFFQTTSARTIQVTLFYPQSAAATNQTQTTYYLFAAKQKTY